MSKKTKYFEVYDEETNKSLLIKAESLEQAEGISETINFNDYDNGAEIDVINDIANYVE